MSDVRPLTASDVVVGCVTENIPKFLAQTLRLVQSIRWFGGELSRSRIVVAAVEQLDADARRDLEALGAEIRIVTRFDPRNHPGNRLQWFREVWDGPEPLLLTLDCDTLVVRDPLPLLRRDVYQAKIAPAPTVTHEVFERLFAHFGLALPERSYTTGYTAEATIGYFNSGVIAMSPAIARRVVPIWRHYNRRLAAQPELVEPCAMHMHQAALAIAVEISGVPVVEAPQELNYQLNATHLPTPPGYAERDPAIIHYHLLVDGDGFLLPTPFPGAQKRIDAFHERLREERARGGARRVVTAREEAPRQIAVVGMHRSGTSVAAQLLAAMGCYAGTNDMLPPGDVFNPTGYWEHRDVVALDEEILKALGATWREPLRAAPSEFPPEARAAFVERARVIARSLSAHGLSVFKDPRLAMLFPIWREALDNPACLLLWRNPAAVARSLESRDGLPLALGLALWEAYTIAMLASTAGLPRVLLSYDDLIADPEASAARIAKELGGGLRVPSEAELRAIVDPALDRQSPAGVTLSEPQQRLRDALQSGDALRVEYVLWHESRDLLEAFSR